MIRQKLWIVKNQIIFGKFEIALSIILFLIEFISYIALTGNGYSEKSVY